MVNISTNNKRIAKNTIMLYTRMLLIMAVTLYTSRVVLEVLGVEDFGIYNIIAGVIVLFSFLNAAMTTATQRYLSIAIGKNDGVLSQKVFSTSLLSHLFLIGIVLILSESIGLWFVNTHLAIPFERKDVAIIIYHIAIITTCFNIIRVPFNASIIANERMSFYAYISIIEAIFKLVIVWVLKCFSFDKLILYSILLLFVTIIINIVYAIYCIQKIDNQRITLNSNMNLFKEMCSFSGWNLFGGIADVGYKQGTNIILNIFCGVTLNAAMGITNQIRAAVYTFVSNLQTAANPQIIKLYASKDILSFHNLICSISKYSVYLMLFLSIPLILNMELILNLWLKNPPEYSVVFSQLILVFCILDSLSGPLWAAMQATGQIRSFMMVTSLCLLLNLPLTYIALWYGYPPESMLLIQIFVVILTLIVRLLFVRRYAMLKVRYYLSTVIVPVILVILFGLPIPILISQYTVGFGRLLTTLITNCICIMIAVYWVGINKVEKQFVISFVKSKLRK